MANSSAAAVSHEHHIVPTSTYALTLVKLLVLMTATVLIAQWQAPDIGPVSGTVVNQVIALVIAIMKAYLVVTIFMGVKWVTPLTRMWATAGFVWFTLMYMIMGDYYTRKYEPLNSWRPVEQSGMPRSLHPGSPFAPMDPNAANLHPRE
jgi:caa(3)-type oxidase subunit IV